ncbi:MAG: hypothetical protein HY917_02330 [Candidatus Diapherotrites archaeon]|nr:hypothetical protein [Candidatus Diapherotrites archaeon]
MGLVIPQKKLMEGRFSPNGSVRVLLSSSDRLRVKDIWGKLPKGKKSAVSLLKEIDKELDSKFF